MRTFRVFTLFLIVLLAVGSIAIPGNNAIGEEKEIKKVTLKVEGMMRSCCAEIVRSALKKVPGVKSVDVSLESKEAVAELEKGKVTTDQLIEAIKEAGYQASLVTDSVDLQIKGMVCSMCVDKVKSALLKVAGVKIADVNLEKKKAHVEFEKGKVTTDQLIEAVKVAGYQATVEKKQ